MKPYTSWKSMPWLPRALLPPITPSPPRLSTDRKTPPRLRSDRRYRGGIAVLICLQRAYGDLPGCGEAGRGVPLRRGENGLRPPGAVVGERQACGQVATRVVLAGHEAVHVLEVHALAAASPRADDHAVAAAALN